VPAPSTGLTRVTVASPQRRVDVALPDGVPLAELLPELLQRSGDDLADSGEQHGGWVLRRVDGAGLPETQTLVEAGVSDGELLHLVPARTDWPELEYDDVVEAIAAGARRLGPPWTGDATRDAAVAVAGFVVVVALAGPLGARLTGGGAVALGVAAVLLAAGVLAARAYGEPLIGAALAGYALPFAFLGGLRILDAGTGAGFDAGTRGAGPLTAPHLLVGGVALVLWSVAGAVGVARGLRIFVAGAAAGVLVALGALLGLGTGVERAAAVLMVVAVLGVTLAPPLAARLGRLPLPVVTPPTATADGADPGRPHRGRVLAAVARSDEMLTGLLAGCGLGAVGAALALRSAGGAGVLLIGVAGAALLLRARLFVTVRQRVPLLAAGLATLAALPAGDLAPASGAGRVVTGVVLVGVVLVVAAAGARYRRQPPSPYLGRAAELLETLCLVSVIPIGCAVLGLYAAVRGLSG